MWADRTASEIPAAKRSSEGKKIMFLVNALRCGGSERNAVAYCRHLDRNRFQPEIMTIIPGGELVDTAQGASVRLTCCPRPSSFSVSYAAKFSRNLAQAPVDLIHVFTHTTQYYAAMARFFWRCKTPIIYSEGTSVPMEGWRALPFHWSLSQADAWVANSPASVDCLVKERVDPSRIHLIPNGHDLIPYEVDLRLDRSAIRAKLGLSAEHHVILFSGRLLDTKRVCDLLDALPLLQVPRARVRVLVAGDGSELHSLRQQTQRLGWTQEVQFLGYRSDVRQLLHASDVFAFPSEVEGLPNSVVEAALMQVPIVAADIEGTRAAVGGNGNARLVPCRRPDLLAAALSETLNDLSVSRLSAQRLRAFAAEQFCMEKAMQRLQDLYDAVIDQKRR